MEDNSIFRTKKKTINKIFTISLKNDTDNDFSKDMMHRIQK